MKLHCSAMVSGCLGSSEKAKKDPGRTLRTPSFCQAVSFRPENMETKSAAKQWDLFDTSWLLMLFFVVGFTVVMRCCDTTLSQAKLDSL